MTPKELAERIRVLQDRLESIMLSNLWGWSSERRLDMHTMRIGTEHELWLLNQQLQKYIETDAAEKLSLI